MFEEDLAPQHLDVADQPVVGVEIADQIGVAAACDRCGLFLGDSVGQADRKPVAILPREIFDRIMFSGPTLPGDPSCEAGAEDNHEQNQGFHGGPPGSDARQSRGSGTAFKPGRSGLSGP